MTPTTHTCDLTGDSLDCAACGYRSEDDLLEEEAAQTDTITPAEAVAIVATLHNDTLALEAGSVTAERADAAVSKSGTQTTTELLLLLARFHGDTGDARGAEMLARFAVEFATVESTLV